VKPPDDRRGDLIASAALGAVMEARWHAQDLLSRKPRNAAPSLLRGLAGEMSFSPVARNQVLSVALNLVADALEQDGDIYAIGALEVLERLGPSEADRLAVRREVLAGGSTPTTEPRQVVETLESHYRPDCRSSAVLARRLRDEASLHELLWDHPKLACDHGTRLVMVFSVLALLERADEIDPKGARAGWRSSAFDARCAARNRTLGGLFAARGWLRRPTLGVAPAGWVAGTGLALAVASTGVLAEAWS
jgi:hypothetical protein